MCIKLRCYLNEGSEHLLYGLCPHRSLFVIGEGRGLSACQLQKSSFLVRQHYIVVFKHVWQVDASHDQTSPPCFHLAFPQGI